MGEVLILFCFQDGSSDYYIYNLPYRERRRWSGLQSRVSLCHLEYILVESLILFRFQFRESDGASGRCCMSGSACGWLLEKGIGGYHI